MSTCFCTRSYICWVLHISKTTCDPRHIKCHPHHVPHVIYMTWGTSVYDVGCVPHVIYTPHHIILVKCSPHHISTSYKQLYPHYINMSPTSYVPHSTPPRHIKRAPRHICTHVIYPHATHLQVLFIWCGEHLYSVGCIWCG